MILRHNLHPIDSSPVVTTELLFSSHTRHLNLYNVQGNYPIKITYCEETKKIALNSLIIGPQREKTLLRRFANNTGADQPAHPRSLISAFVIRFVESIICYLATGEISTF